MIDEKELATKTDFIRNVGNGNQDFVLGFVGDNESQKKLENEIVLRIGGTLRVKGDTDNNLKDKAQKECEAEWKEKVSSYLDVDNNINANKADLLLKHTPRDFKGYEDELAKRLYGIEQYGKAVEKKQLAEEIFNSKDERTLYTVKEGKNFEQYGFNKEEVYNAIAINAINSKDNQVKVPTPKLRKLSFADKMKKRLTGKCQADEDNKKIQKQYDEFMGKAQQLFSGIDWGNIGLNVTQLNDLEKFKDVDKIRDAEVVDFHSRMKDYVEARRYETLKDVAIYDFNEKNKEEVLKIEEIRKQKEEQKKQREEEAKLTRAAEIVNKISDGQFRDVDVAKDDAGKTEEAKQRYYARKILKDRGLLPQAGKPVVKREVSKDMIRQSVQGGRS